MHCATVGTALPGASGVTPVRSLFVGVSDASLLPAWLPVPAAAAAPYAVDPGLLVRGYECKTNGTCAPEVPAAGEDVNVVPDTGTTAGARLAGTDVLTIRYLADRGVALAGDASGDTIAVTDNLGAAPAEFGAKDLALIADCGNAEVFATKASGKTATHKKTDGNFADKTIATFKKRHDARVFNFSKDFVSVTYYVGVAADPEDPTRTGGALYRIENGVTEMVVDGVERMDLRYVVQDGDGGMHRLTAAQVDANTPGMACPPLPVGMPAPAGGDVGCLWRAVQGIDVSLLLDSVRDDGHADEPFRYSPDGTGVQSYAAGDKLPSGLPAGRRLRREFSFLATLHNFSR
jgi:type IV pilus assembly protein PilW